MATLPTNIPANGILTPDPALDPVLTPISDHAEQLSLAEAGVSALETTRNDRWYPKFHIASNGGWINDPNGLCRYNGRWHVFYQLHPHGTQWGPMHWGHVSSETWSTGTANPSPSRQASNRNATVCSPVPP